MANAPADSVFDDDDDFDAAPPTPPRPARVPGSAVGKIQASADAFDDVDDEEDADDTDAEEADLDAVEGLDDAVDEADDDDDALEDVIGDDEPGDVIDGTEDDVPLDVEDDEEESVVADEDDDEEADVDDPAVAAAVRAVRQATAKPTPRTAPMANTQKPAKKTKADYIREMIAHLKTKTTEPIRPRDVIAALAKKGVEVTAPQVSVTLRDYEADNKSAKPAKPTKPEVTAKSGDRPAKPARPTAPTAEVSRPAMKVRPTDATAHEPSFNELRSVSAFVKFAGGVTAARALLDSYAELLDTAG